MHSRLFAEMHDTLDKFLLFFCYQFRSVFQSCLRTLQLVLIRRIYKGLSQNPDAVPFSRERLPGLTAKAHSHHLTPAWMSEEVSKRLGSVGYNPNIPRL